MLGTYLENSFKKLVKLCSYYLEIENKFYNITLDE
jgi:hypothetical protein